MPHPPRAPDRTSPPDTVPGYRRTLGDRFGADAGLIVRCASYGLYVFGIALLAAPLAVSVAGGRAATVALIVGGGMVVALCTSLFAWYLARGAGVGFKAFVQPSGSSTPYREQFSYETSLAARGDVAGALEAYERRIAADPADVEVRVQAAELYAAAGRDPARAAALFRELRAIPSVPAERALYASHRLVDLYRGPLADEGRALVELRRIIESFPGSTAAAHAREALRKLKN